MGITGLTNPLGSGGLENCAMDQKNNFMGGYSITNIDPKDGNHGTFQAISLFIIQSPFIMDGSFFSLM